MKPGAARSVVLTGASSGIGAALAAALAGPGRRMLLVGRDAARLSAVAEAARGRGALAEAAAIPVTEGEALAARLRAFDAAHPVDLLIANAGVTSGRGPEGWEPPGQSHWIVDVNLKGVFNTVEPLLPALVARGAGRIVLVASMAALRPQADEPSYSASKAAVRAWGLALRPWLRAHGVGVTVVNPGFVTSPMSARHLGPRPFEIGAERAAAIILRGLDRGRSEITFPRGLAALVALGRLLPPRLSDLAERRFAARILPDPGRPGGGT